MKILVLASKHVRELLTYTECADVMREALAGLARGQIQQPLRTVVRPREAAGFMGLMPSYSPETGYGLKALVITPGNPAIGKDAHQGGVLLSDVRTGEPLFVSTRRERNELFPELAEQARSGGAMVVLPLAVEGRVFGAMALSFEEEVEFGLERREMKIALARLASQNLARSQLYEEEQALRERMTFLAEASEILSSSLDYHHTLGKLARLAVPGLADWCTIDMAGENGEIERLAVAHEDPEKVRWASELQERYPPNPDDPHGVPQVLRSGEPEFFPSIPAELLDEAIGAAATFLAASVGGWAVLHPQTSPIVWPEADPLLLAAIGLLAVPGFLGRTEP